MTRARKIPLARPSFDGAEERALCETVRSGWVTQGPRVLEFERAFAAYVGAGHAVAVSSATAGLFLALRVKGVGPGNEVVVPSLSFIATANSIVHAGAAPVFADSAPGSLNADAESIERAITPRTRAILAVDQLGMPADMEPLRALADSRGLVLVEDAACALGSRYRGEHVGRRADLVCYSFHPRKVLTTGEGGMITTDDPEVAARLRRLRHQGMSVSDLERHAAAEVVIESYPEIGYNFRLSDLHAAVGIVQMEKLPAMLAARRRAAERYDRALADLPGLGLFAPPPGAAPNHQSYVVRLRSPVGSAGEREQSGRRDRLMNALHRRGVASRRGVMAIHREPPYADARRAGDLAETERTSDESFLLPMHPGLTEDDQERVVDALSDALAELS